MKIEGRIQHWIQCYEENGYLNGSLLVASHGKILLNKGFGMANWEHGVPNKPTTKFRIGSLTKAFTALAILQLQEQGKLNIHDAIGKYLSDYPEGEQISIYHCLTNTSGIPDYTSFPDFWQRTMRLPMTLRELIDSFEHLELNFKPGSEFEYSNSGYALVTAILEEVSGMAYGDYIQENICLPLGMYNTGCDNGVKVISNLASGYSFWEQPIHSAYADLSFPLGAYGLYSTTEDLFLWDQALRAEKLLKPELMELMFTANLDSYACGWMISDMVGRKCHHHFGDISGFFNDFLRFVDDEVTIIFLSNMDITPVTHLTQEIAKVIFEEEVSLPLPAKPIEFVNRERIAGTYGVENETGPTLEISFSQNALYVTVPKMYGILYKFKLVPVHHDGTKTIFITETINERLTFYYSRSGTIERIVYKDYLDRIYVLSGM